MAATVKQLAFIDTLVRERTVPVGVEHQIYEIAGRADASPGRGGPISKVIDQLLAMPKRTAGAPAPAAGARRPSFSQRLKDAVPEARYIIERCEVPVAHHGLFGGNDDAYFEVREFKGTRYLRQLHGAPGDFNRSKPSAADQSAVVDALLAVGPLVATQRYSTRHTCCSCCSAPLTDRTSRMLGLGPDCRKRFGL